MSNLFMLRGTTKRAKVGGRRLLRRRVTVKLGLLVMFN